MRSFLFDVVRYLVEAEADENDDELNAVLNRMFNVGLDLDKSIRRHMG